MAYIRCLSNPEGLYVWGDIDGNTYFCWNDTDHHMVGVPSEEVDKFFLELYKWETLDWEGIDLDYPFTHGNLSVVECRVPTGEKSVFDNESEVYEFKIKLTFGQDHPDLILWRTTWNYLRTVFTGALSACRHLGYLGIVDGLTV